MTFLKSSLMGHACLMDGQQMVWHMIVYFIEEQWSPVFLLHQCFSYLVSAAPVVVSNGGEQDIPDS